MTVVDATLPGVETHRQLLAGVPSPVTLRDLIRFRVREEVARYNANPAPRFNGLVQPLEAENSLNGSLRPAPRRLDWNKQAQVALTAFAHHGFFVLVDDRQVEDLDEELTLRETDLVRFIKLVHLAGG